MTSTVIACQSQFAHTSNFAHNSNAFLFIAMSSKRAPKRSSEPDFPLTQHKRNKHQDTPPPTEEEDEKFIDDDEEPTQQLEDEPMPEASPETPADVKKIDNTLTPQTPVKTDHVPPLERSDNAEANRNLLDEFQQAATHTEAPKPDVLKQQLDAAAAANDALMLQAIQAESTAEKPAPSIFAVAEEFDIENHNNLYFRNPRLEQASIRYERSLSKKAQKWFENIRVNFADEQDYQQWCGKDQWNAAFITPPGSIELANFPPFGNLSEVGSGVPYAPKYASECNASLNYSSKHFYLNSDRDQIEYEKRTRAIYAKTKEEKAVEEYKKANPTVKFKKDIPKEAYAFVQEGPLSKEQIAELPDNEKRSYCSKEVNGFFHFFKSRVEDVMQEKVLENPANNCPSLKNAVETSIKDQHKKDQEAENRAAEKDKREPVEIEPQDFDTVLRRSFRSKVQNEKSGGIRFMKFSKKLFRPATDAEKAGLANGTIQCANAEITRICKENALMPQTFDVYRFLSASELASNPNADPLQKMSVAEAYKLITVKNEGKFIGQVAFTVSPLVVQGELGLYCAILGVVYWGPPNAYREPRTLRSERVSKPVLKKIYAPAPTVAQSTDIDVSDFASMKIPAMRKFEKKDKPAAADGTKPIDAPAS